VVRLKKQIQRVSLLPYREYYEKGLVLKEQTKFLEAQESIKGANQLKQKKQYTKFKGRV
jgi:hypothetical protein